MGPLRSDRGAASANYFQEEYFGAILDKMGEVRALTLMRAWLREVEEF